MVIGELAVPGDQIQVTDIDGGKLLSCPEYFDISVAAELQRILLSLLSEKPESIILMRPM